MSEPKSRYQRRIEVIDYSIKPLTRYERFDRVFSTILDEVRAGSDLVVQANAKRIQISLGADRVGVFPTLEVGLRCIGDLLENNGAITSIEGDCPGTDSLDQELLSGNYLTVSKFGDKLKVCWIRNLSAQEFDLKDGATHRVARRGIRTWIHEETGTKIFSMFRQALAAPERIERMCLLSCKTE